MTAPTDALEREADEIARSLAPNGSTATSTAALAAHLPGNRVSVESRISSPGAGTPLEPSVRSVIEDRIGADLGGVRIHESPQDRSAADSIEAKAFTFGTHVYLGTGASVHDLHLMAHEMTHVIQQQPQLRDRRVAAMLPDRPPRTEISRSPRRIMRMDWSHEMNRGRMPRCGEPSQAAFPNESVQLGAIPPGAREGCMYTPLFHVPEFRLPDGQHRIRIVARVPNPRMECREHDWSMNVYECHAGRSSRPDCEVDRGSSYVGGRIGTSLEKTYPPPGPTGLWSTRNLSVRVSNGCPFPIEPRLTVEYPTMPEPTAWEQFSQGIHMMLDLLGLTEPFGVFFDGVNAVIYASEGEWAQVGISIGASIPLAGAGLVALRRMRRAGDEVIGMVIPRDALRTLRSAEVAAALQRARAAARGAEAVEPGARTGRGASRLADAARLRAQIARSGAGFLVRGERHLIGVFEEGGIRHLGLCSDCASMTEHLRDIADALPAGGDAVRAIDELLGRVIQADRSLTRGRAGRPRGIDPELDEPLSRAFTVDLSYIADEYPVVADLLNMEPSARMRLARSSRPMRIVEILRTGGRPTLESLRLPARGWMELSESRLVLHVDWIEGRSQLSTVWRTARRVAQEAGVRRLVVEGRPLRTWGADFFERFPNLRPGDLGSFSFDIN